MKMSVIKELIRTEADGTLSFGDYELAQKAKRSDYEHKGDLYKVKTFNEITKLERNGLFVYESVPGTAVEHFQMTEQGVSFSVEAAQDAQIILGLAEDADYKIYIQNVDAGTMNTNTSGKLVLSVETEAAESIQVKVVKL